MLKRKTKLRAYLLAAICCVFGISAGGSIASAADGDSYNYSVWGETVVSPSAYEATTLMTGATLGVGAFKDPSDLHVTVDNEIYVLDSGNNRIVVLDKDYRQMAIIDSFEHDGATDTFLNPQGIFVSEQKHVLIADTGNKRVVHLDEEGRLAQIVEKPESEMLPANFEFQPVRVVMDKAQRIYVMAIGVFDGLMEFSAEGAFTSYIGANRVWVDPVELFWKRLSTKAQRSQMVMFTPTEFTNMDINDEGFIYSTSGDSGDTIRKLNAQGNDILRRTGFYKPQGDLNFTSDLGPSRLIDVDITDSEIYSVLDSKRGRIFTYNGDGQFMYVFGGMGNRIGEFNTPVAIERVGDDFLVLDKAFGEMTLFRTTEYGRTLNEAVRSYYRGEEDKALQLYEQTINMNTNLDFAYSGIGKAILRQGDYDDAMRYFKQSLDQPNYSKAFLLYRKEVLRANFSTIMTVVIGLAAVSLIIRLYRKKQARKRGVSFE